MIRLYGLKTCDTCRKALKLLDDAELVDIRAEPLPADLLARAHAQFGEKLVNMRSTTWRGLSESERARPVPELLEAHPALMKRPLIERAGVLYLGWTPETRQALGAG